MLIDVKYKGLNYASSDYDAEAGSLAVAHNVVDEHGYLEPLSPPAQLIAYTSANHLEGYVCKFKHVMPDGTEKYIFYRPAQSGETGGTVRYMGIDDADSTLMTLSNNVKTAIATESGLYAITAVGKTLCILTSTGMDYCLWTTRSQVTSYYELGTTLPEPVISFSLQSELKEYDNEVGTFDFDFARNGSSATSGTHEFVKGDDDAESTVATIFGKVAASENCAARDGYYVHPLLVRYALRLYDGNLTHHSAPVLLMASDKAAPVVWADTVTLDNQTWKVQNAKVTLPCSKIDYRVMDADGFADWSDVVTAVEVYVSRPMYTHQVEGWIDSMLWSAIQPAITDPTLYPNVYGKLPPSTSTETTVYMVNNVRTHMWGNRANVHMLVNMPEDDWDAKDVSLFYRVAELKQLSTSASRCTLPDVDLRNLVNYQLMTDDYDSHSRIIPTGVYKYNDRINIYGITRKYDLILNPYYLLQYLEVSGSESGTANVDVYMTTRESGKDYVFKHSETNMPLAMYSNVRYLYIPVSTGVKVQLYHGTDVNRTEIFGSMIPHSMLNGSYYYGKTPMTGTAMSSNPPTTTLIPAIDLPNKIYTSEVGNPLFFPLAGVNTVGVGRIKALGVATKSMGVGQFGEFPLYVFTDSGIWAMELLDNGLYRARQPMSLDVILGDATPAGDAVVYATSRGVMIASGDSTKCISDVLDGPVVNINSGWSSVATLPPIMVGWNTYKTDLHFAYDNVRQLLYAYNPTGLVGGQHYDYHYVYSARTGQWYTHDGMYGDAVTASLVNAGNALLDVTGRDSTEPTFALVTRPLSFSTDALKKLRDNIQRGSYVQDTTYSVKCILEASVDMVNWVVVGSSTKHRIMAHSGSPYKYFRWTVVGKLKPHTGLTGLTADVIVVRNNRLR